MTAVEPMDFSSYTLGTRHDPILMDRSEDVRSACLALARQARRSIIITSRQLDPLVYNNSDFGVAIRDFALSSRNARLRILVSDTGPAIHSGHRLIDLSQRLSSFIEIRIPDQQQTRYNSAFVVVDSCAYLFREQSDLYAAQCCFGDRKFSDELSRQFENMWETALPDLNLRRLQI